MPAKHRGKYGAAHDQRSRQLRTRWNADPSTTCALCGLTLAQGVERWGADLARWEADHPDGRTDAGLRPAHRHCNASEGAARGNRQREPHSETW